MIDLRSDTVTLPTKGMMTAMMEAPLGDDVFGEDPTVNKLEEKMAEMFGMQSSLFCPSGTMTNQIAIKCHTQPGGEVICNKLSHVYIYEAGGIAFNSGCQVKAIEGDRGMIRMDQVQNAINPDDIHKAKTSLVVLENTSNRGGGACYAFSEIQKIKQVCIENNLPLHLDGARLFNALIAKNDTATDYGKTFDSISICLSKGLGAPVGSVLVGSKGFINKARKIRKIFGGGMRQAGVIAAAGIYALENNIERLAEDHRHANQIAVALLEKDFVGEILPVETNIIIFEVKGKFTAATLTVAFNKQNIKVMAISPTQVRMVLHLGVSDEMVNSILTEIKKL